MTYQLKTSAFCAKIKTVIAVDSDDVGAAWTTQGASRAWSIGAGLTAAGATPPSIVTDSWKGTARKAIRIPGTGRLEIDAALQSVSPMCLVFVVRNATMADSGMLAISAATTSGTVGITNPHVIVNSVPQPVLKSSSGISVAYINRTFAGTEHYSIALCLNTNGLNDTSYFAAEAASTATVTARDGYGETLSNVFWRQFGTGGSPAWAGDVIAILVLSALPTQAEFEALHADPVGVLFDVSASSPVISSPTGAVTSTTAATVTCSTDTLSDGTMRFLRRTGGAAASAATIVSTGESQATSGSNPQSRSVTLLSGTANQYVDIAQAGTTGNSNVITAGPLDTSTVVVATLAGALDTITGAVVAGAAAIIADLNGALDGITGAVLAGGTTGRLTSALPLRDAARVALANRSDVAVHVLGKPGLASIMALNAQSIASGIWTAAGPFTIGQRYNVLYEVGGEPIGCEIITAGAV